MTWKTFGLQLVTQLCEAHGSRSFSLDQLCDYGWRAMVEFAPRNHHRVAKLRQTLQFLRDDGLLSFVDGRGNYTLLGETILPGEVEAEALPLLKAFQGEAQKREYLIEIYARDKGLVSLARRTFGARCLCAGCTNSFLKDDGTPYCEVHHIVPLCQDGEDALPNLSVLCAHHHRMAHFAASAQRSELKSFLLDTTRQILAQSPHSGA